MNYLETTVSELAIDLAQALVDKNLYKQELERVKAENERLKLEIESIKEEEENE